MREELYDDPPGGNADAPPLNTPVWRRALTTGAGALASFAILAGVVFWSYKLGMQEAAEVPVIKASADPMKIQPEDPGGQVFAHQGLSVYTAVTGEAPEREPKLAPPPEELAKEDATTAEMAEMSRLIRLVEDQPDLAKQAFNAQQGIIDDEENAEAGLVAPTLDLSEITADLTLVYPTRNAPRRSPAPNISGRRLASLEVPADLVESLIAQARQEEQASAETTGPRLFETNETLAAAPADPGEPVLPQDEPFATALSPMAPVTLGEPPDPTESAAFEEPAEPAANGPEDIELALKIEQPFQIQLGALPSEDVVRKQWGGLRERNGDLLAGRILIIQPVVSGGQTLYRLRVGPFSDRLEASQVCQALRARGEDCIVARPQ